MQEAYEKAVWARPDLREKLINEQTSGIRQQNAQQDRVNAARNAGVSVAGSPVTNSRPAGSTPNRTLREELAANLKASTGRI